MGLELEFIEARDLPDAWFQAVYRILEKGREYVIDRGSYKGQKRLELDYVTIHVKYPGTRPLIPDIPPSLGIPNPVSEEYVYEYLPYLMCSKKKEGEEYTYGYYLEKQIEEVIRMYKEDGYNTNQAYMTVGEPDCIYMKDPPCLRGIDTRIKDGKLHFFVYFRCIDGKTNIVAKVNDSIVVTTVEDIFRIFKDGNRVEVISVNEDFEPVWSKVLSIERNIKYNVVNVELYGAGSLLLTEDHKIPVYENGSVVLKRVDQLKANDVVLEPKCLSRLKVYDNSYIDLLSLCGGSSKLYVYDLPADVFKELRDKKIKYKPSWRDNRHLPFSIASQTYLRDIPELKCKCQKQRNIPRMFKITKQMAYFMGVWLADGWYNAKGNALRVAIKESDSLKLSRILDFMNDEFNYTPHIEKRDGCVVLNIGILFLAELFKSCGFIHGSRVKVIPNFIFNLPPELLEELFIGWLSSDAGVSTSDKLISGFSAILKFLDERFSIYSEKPRKSFFAKEDRIIKSSNVQHIVLLENFKYKRLDINNNFIGRKVKKISKIHFGKVVYDLTIDSPSHLFACGQTPILVHNSWDLWNGFPANLAAIQLLKEYMAESIGVEDGELVAASKGLHLYDYVWELAKMRTMKKS